MIGCKFTYARSFSEGLAQVTEVENKLGVIAPTGFIDTEGIMILKPQFYSVNDFRQGLCLVETENSIGYINRLGEFVWQGPYVEYGLVL